MEALLGFVLAGLALAGSPGPATLSLAATGAAYGTRRGLAYMAGLWLGMVAVMGITASGLTAMLLTLPGALPIVIALSAAYFIYLAWRIALAPPLSDDAPERPAPSFMAGLLLSLVNPKGYAAMAALFSGFTLLPNQWLLDALAKVVVLGIVIAAVNIAWLLAGAALTHCFRAPKLNRLINIGFAAALLLSLVLALLL